MDFNCVHSLLRSEINGQILESHVSHEKRNMELLSAIVSQKEQ